MHADSVRPVEVALDGQRVVEIARRRRVDGKDAVPTQVLSDLVLALGDTTISNVQPVDSPPGERREALDGEVRELLGGEVAVLEQRAGLNLGVADGPEFLDKGSEGMQRRAVVSGDLTGSLTLASA